jgi:aminoglycoside phosphotransferase (APT) family kinase protein
MTIDQGTLPTATAASAAATTAATAPAWAAERDVTPADVAGWLRDAGVTLTAPVEPVAEGFDNYIFAADGLYIRATRRAAAAADLRQEARLLPLLCQDLPLKVPSPTLIPEDIDTAPWPWFAFRPVEGEDCVQAVLRGDDLCDAARALGRALKTLHDPAWLPRVRGWVRTDTFRRVDMPYRVGLSRLRLQELIDAGDDLPLHALLGALDDAESLGALPGVALIHGDLHIRHLILSPDLSLNGLIDWGDAHVGHPACDLYPLWSLFRARERAAFLSAYGPLDGVTLRAGRVVSIYINAVLAQSALDFGLPGLRVAALEALRRAAQPL